MTVDEKLDLLLEKVTSMDNRLEKVENRLDKVDNRLEKVEEGLENLDTKVTDTRLHLENVTDRNINLLAEGHELFVSKYSKVEEVSDKQFAYYVKVNNMAEKVDKLEKEVEKLKNRTA